MTLWSSNLASYSAQLASLVGAAMIASWALRIRSPRSAHFLWNAVLVGSVLLPVMCVWQTQDTISTSVLVQIVGVRSADARFQAAQIATILLALAIAGAMLRLAWIAVGLTRLSLIRRRSCPLLPMPAFIAEFSDRLGVRASIHVSADVACPVTLGFFRPLVLLPARAVELPEAIQRAIVCHELLHVRRRDWLRTVVEQAWSALLWFHPAAYLLLSRIALMREAVVDQETILVIGDRRTYVQTLLAFAEPFTAVTPLPVMHLIKPRHLPHRIALIAQEVRMSRRHSIAATAAALLIASMAAHATSERLPLALPSTVEARILSSLVDQGPYKPGDGVSLPRVTKEVKPQYTPGGMQQRIQGSVWMEVVVLPSGEPTDIKVTRSLDAQYGLDDAAVRATSQWRFEPGRRDGKPVPVVITIEMTFTLKQ